MLTSLFQPGYLKEAVLLAHNARKLLHRQADLLSPAEQADYAASIAELEAVTRGPAAGDRQQVEAAAEKLDRKFGKLHPQRADAGWRENCEVLLVAFVLAIALRAYFIQPFKIPTGSMEPTLNGITAHVLPPDQPMPGFFARIFESLWAGRTYVEVISPVDDRLENLIPETHYFFMTYTRIMCESGREYVVHVPPETLAHDLTRDGFGLSPGQVIFHAGKPILRGYVETGDKVFVDKFTYNFRPPKRADVFVFSTSGIEGIHISEPNVTSEFYIKRLGGVPGDTLRIAALRLYINGPLAQEAPFTRVMSLQNGYQGYSNFLQFMFLTTPTETFTVPPKSYFALGDNSFNSSDSRAWGRVPAENVVGRGLFVYWPFGPRWGLIH